MDEGIALVVVCEPFSQVLSASIKDRKHLQKYSFFRLQAILSTSVEGWNQG